VPGVKTHLVVERVRCHTLIDRSNVRSKCLQVLVQSCLLLKTITTSHGTDRSVLTLLLEQLLTAIKHDTHITKHHSSPSFAVASEFIKRALHISHFCSSHVALDSQFCRKHGKLVITLYKVKCHSEPCISVTTMVVTKLCQFTKHGNLIKYYL